MRIRRDSHVTFGETRSTHRPGYTNPFVSGDGVGGRRHSVIRSEEDDDATPTDDRTPLLRASPSQPSPSTHGREYGGMYGASSRRAISAYTGRSGSVGSGHSGQRRPRAAAHRENSNSLLPQPTYDVNNPPSMPPSPILGPQNGVDDGFDPDAFPGPGLDRRPTGSRAGADGEHLVDIDGDGESAWQRVSDAIAARMPPMAAEDDVCFPVEGMSELGEEDFLGAPGTYGPNGPSVEIATGRRKRTRRWPDLGVLEEWSREERAERSEEIRAKKISEPVLVGGRLRPQKQGWHREEADAPFRFTYFNEEFPSTIHSQTISELLQPGQSFRELFVPDPPELSDESSNGEEDLMSQGVAAPPTASADAGLDSSSSRGATTRESSNREDGRTREPSNRTESRTADTSTTSPRTQSASQSPPNEKAPASAKPKRYGARPTFWLDVLSPTEVEMRVIQKTFGIHPLTAEDILMQEAREKVELFRNYYFVNYRTFEQDQGNDDYLEPVDMYVVVFREGVISFHFSMTPHPANVRRRIRQLKDYLVLTADWISYAIIDDITDVFQPLIASIEKEVDDIDDVILQMHGSTTTVTNENSRGGGGNGSKTGNGTSIRKGATADDEKHSTKSEMAAGSGGDMLRRVGEGRKKVMGLYRLLGNKADVIKGFAKRCNEQWEIAPRSEIGLYLGDIQDHILTMTSNLSHYETYVLLFIWTSCAAILTAFSSDYCRGHTRTTLPRLTSA